MPFVLFIENSLLPENKVVFPAIASPLLKLLLKGVSLLAKLQSDFSGSDNINLQNL